MLAFIAQNGTRNELHPVHVSAISPAGSVFSTACSSALPNSLKATMVMLYLEPGSRLVTVYSLADPDSSVEPPEASPSGQGPK